MARKYGLTMTPTLDVHGGASRCLLRLREDEGNPPLSETAFLRQFSADIPLWETQPGKLTSANLLPVARELGLADFIVLETDYDRVLAAHDEGHRILVQTVQFPEYHGESGSAPPLMLVLETMNEFDFRVWCPYPSGNSSSLGGLPRPVWESWNAIGIILHKAENKTSRG